ncbi:MAG: UDP-N-acetylglucosamine 1-carboxyvinyltransferase [Acidobacteriota bacterium]
MNRKFIISGRHKLSGEYPVQGNKNAALPLIAAALLSSAPVRLHNVPRIVDVENLLRLIESLGVSVEWEEGTLMLDPGSLDSTTLAPDLTEKLRGSVLLLGVLASRVEEISSAMPGGCSIGSRTFDAHWSVFRAAGFEVEESRRAVRLRKVRSVDHPRVYLEESSVTATENGLLLFASLGSGVIENPAREPHVLSLIDFLRQLGCEIELHPLYYRIRRGIDGGQGEVDFQVPADYIDAGTIAIAAAVTDSRIVLKGARIDDLVGISNVLRRFGVTFEEAGTDSIVVSRSEAITNPARVTVGLWPSFPTDLASLVIVLATQGAGLCLIHDWMYEARMFFIDKLVRMGARITMCDPHRVLVQGPTLLQGTQLESPDIRAGMALVVAGLCAEGTTTIEHAEVIMRGYEGVAERLRRIGADVRADSDGGNQL